VIDSIGTPAGTRLGIAAGVVVVMATGGRAGRGAGIRFGIATGGKFEITLGERFGIALGVAGRFGVGMLVPLN
jgi:hypothetical protein